MCQTKSAPGKMRTSAEWLFPPEGRIRRFLTSLFCLLPPSLLTEQRQRQRAERFTRIRYGDKVFQGFTYTRADRFPVLFHQCRTLLAGRVTPYVLSFGCSTGEEVFSLAHYLPEAHIIGVDISDWCLRQCRRRNTDPRLMFLDSRSSAFENTHSFDAIFALAVLQRTENSKAGIKSVATGFRFSQFEDTIISLDRKLKIDGFLFIDHADFDFAETSVAWKYVPLPFPNNRRQRKRVLFGKDNKAKALSYMLPRAYRKISAT